MRKRLLPDRLAGLDRRRLILISVGSFLLSVVVSLVILFAGGAGDKEVPVETFPPAAELRISDFILPPVEEIAHNSTYIFRERLSRWNDEQVNRFWIPLKKIVLDIIIEENNERIEELFRDIP